MSDVCIWCSHFVLMWFEGKWYMTLKNGYWTTNRSVLWFIMCQTKESTEKSLNEVNNLFIGFILFCFDGVWRKILYSNAIVEVVSIINHPVNL